MERIGELCFRMGNLLANKEKLIIIDQNNK